ncbi:hypothetical protein [Kitasatospora sp. NBC_00458]|uniref:hypothetical protein n=1 Tax=Kitasatospora sp. NBC_00458 TaxID=2903568 RepID=UPI002E18E39D
MICPHCRQQLLHRERYGRRCGRCRREFALEPKLDQGLHDLRVMQHAARLTDGGRLLCTTDQLRWSLVKRQQPRALPDKAPAEPPAPVADTDSPGCAAAGAAVPLTVAALWAVLAPAYPLLALAPAAFGLWFLFGLLVIAVERRQLPRKRREWQRSHDRWTEHLREWQHEQRRWTEPLVTPVDLTAQQVRSSLMHSWKSTYGALPEGVVDESTVRPARPPGAPALAVLCPDPTVTAFLHANGFPGRHDALLVRTPEEIPAGLPVVVLHDASPQGLLLVADTRAALPGRRVVDAGLSARTVLAEPTRTVQLYTRQQRAVLAEQLARIPGLTDAERTWYEKGLSSPIAAQPPKRVMAAAERAAERARGRDLGFLSWPAPPAGPAPAVPPARPADLGKATPEAPR